MQLNISNTSHQQEHELTEGSFCVISPLDTAMKMIVVALHWASITIRVRYLFRKVPQILGGWAIQTYLVVT